MRRRESVAACTVQRVSVSRVRLSAHTTESPKLTTRGATMGDNEVIRAQPFLIKLLLVRCCLSALGCDMRSSRRDCLVVSSTMAAVGLVEWVSATARCEETTAVSDNGFGLGITHVVTGSYLKAIASEALSLRFLSSSSIATTK